MTARAAIDQSELFGGLSPDTRAAVAAAAERRSLAEGELLFQEGDPGAFVFSLGSGGLSARKRTDTGEVELRRLGPGEVGGLTSTTGDQGRSVSMLALEPSELWLVHKVDFVALTAAHADLSRALLSFLARKVRRKTGEVARLLPRPDGRTSVAFFDAKSYEVEAFGAQVSDRLDLHFLEPKLTSRTAGLAEGHAVVCAFVNDDLGAPVLERLAGAGVGLIALRCAGFNNVDLPAARALGLEVLRVPAYSPHAVAEHAVALLLALDRKVHRAHNRVREGNFHLAGLVGFDLYGKTAGIVGFGKIGRCLATILRGFGMRVLAYDARPDPEAARAHGVELVELDALLAASDVLSLHAPLMAETHHLIDAARIARMKRGAVLINTSRGGLVDASALLDGLMSGQIGAAGLDVYEEESEYFFEDRSDRPIDDPRLARLIGLPNVLVTSHQGFLTHEALANIAGTTLGNIEAWVGGARGEALDNSVL